MKVELKKLTKTFNSTKNHRESKAVRGIDLTIPDGKLVVLLGPSGCGKSTTLDMICGLTEATSGEIYFGEDNVTSIPPEKRGVGMVFQNYALYPHLTVFQNIRFPLENLKGAEKLNKIEAKQRVIEAAKLVQIDELLDRKPSQLSGGQQQRVAIARALVKMPGILLLDEPLSNLDARLRLQTREEIRRIQKETGITTVFVTHDQEEAMSISDLIVVMNKGQIMQVGMPQEVYDEPNCLFVAEFLGSPQINLFNGVIKDGELFIGKENAGKYNCEDGEVIVGIRPEGLTVDTNGILECTFDTTEVLGRDISVLSSHPDSINGVIHAISNIRFSGKSGDKVRFSVNRDKTFIFSKTDGNRIL